MKRVMTGAISLVAAGLMSGGLAMAAQGYDTSAKSDDMTALQNRMTSMEQTLEKMSQHANRPAQANEGWSKYIRVSGGVAVDAKLAGSLGDVDDNSNTIARFSGVNSKRFGVNDAFMNVDAMINDWTSARIGVSYMTVSENYGFTNNRVSNTDNGNLNVDQAYITLANFDKSPFYLRAGQQYFDFGQYNLHPITKSFTQVLSETNDVGVQVGFLHESGLNGSVFIDQIPARKRDSDGSVDARRDWGYGGSVSYATDFDNFSLNGKLGYLSNMTMLDVYQRGDASFGSASASVPGTYETEIPELAAMIGATSGPFDVNLYYTTALSTFDSADIQYKVGEGARPAAFDINAGYTFKFLNDRDNKVVLGYGTTAEASSFGLPKDRYYIDYNIEVYKNTNFMLEWAHDVDYSRSNLAPASANFVDNNGDPVTATGRNYNVVSARLAVNFG